MHIIGPYERFPLAEDRGYTAPEAPASLYRKLMQTLGIDRVVVVQPSCHSFDHAAVINAMAELGNCARAVAVLPPTVDERELARLNEAGCRGVRLAALLHGGVPLEAAPEMAARIRAYGWHLQLQLDGPARLESLMPMLTALPVPIVVDGMGRFGPKEDPSHPQFAHLLQLLKTGRCWVKLTGEARRSHFGPPYSDMRPIAEALINARPDRLVWGTDWPHVQAWDHSVPNDTDLLEWLLFLGIDDQTIKKILVDNPAELYGFH